MPWPTTSRQSRGYGADHDRMRDHLKRTVVTCEECARQGRVTLGSHADHIVPKAQGGSNKRSNYQWLCAPCHEAKTLRERGIEPGLGGGVDTSGRPTNPHHPWNRAACP